VNQTEMEQVLADLKSVRWRRWGELTLEVMGCTEWYSYSQGEAAGWRANQRGACRWPLTQLCSHWTCQSEPFWEEGPDWSEHAGVSTDVTLISKADERERDLRWFHLVFFCYKSHLASVCSFDAASNCVDLHTIGASPFHVYLYLFVAL